MKHIKKFGVRLTSTGPLLEEMTQSSSSDTYDFYISCKKEGPFYLNNYFWEYEVQDSNGSPTAIEIGGWNANGCFRSFQTWRQQGIWKVDVFDTRGHSKELQFHEDHPNCLIKLVKELITLSSFATWREAELSETLTKLTEEISKLQAENKSLKGLLKQIKKSISPKLFIN